MDDAIPKNRVLQIPTFSDDDKKLSKKVVKALYVVKIFTIFVDTNMS